MLVPGSNEVLPITPSWNVSYETVTLALVARLIRGLEQRSNVSLDLASTPTTLLEVASSAKSKDCSLNICAVVGDCVHDATHENC